MLYKNQVIIEVIENQTMIFRFLLLHAFKHKDVSRHIRKKAIVLFIGRNIFRIEIMETDCKLKINKKHFLMNVEAALV